MKDYQKFSNKRADKVAKDLGEKGAEEFKANFTNDGSKFNIGYDKETGEVILMGIRNGKIIYTGYFIY